MNRRTIMKALPLAIAFPACGVKPETLDEWNQRMLGLAQQLDSQYPKEVTPQSLWEDKGEHRVQFRSAMSKVLFSNDVAFGGSEKEVFNTFCSVLKAELACDASVDVRNVDIHWLNVQNPTLNPEGKIGFWAARMTGYPNPTA